MEQFDIFPGWTYLITHEVSTVYDCGNTAVTLVSLVYSHTLNPDCTSVVFLSFENVALTLVSRFSSRYLDPMRGLNPGVFDTESLQLPSFITASSVTEARVDRLAEGVFHMRLFRPDKNWNGKTWDYYGNIWYTLSQENNDEWTWEI